MELFNEFKSIQKQLKAYRLVLNIASWDSNTEAPKKCFPYRADMLSFISGESFSLSTSPRYQEVVNGLIKRLDELEVLQQKEVKEAKKNLDKIIKIPKEDYVAYNKLLNLAQRTWEDAKANDDYEAFKPSLQEIIAMQRKIIKYRDTGKEPYNVLLDDFEEGMNMELYDSFFNTLKEDLVPFVKEVLAEKKEEDQSFITAFYPKAKQKEFVDYLLEVFRYDLDRGVLKESVHPFTWNTHSQDVRLTVRYLENFVFSSIFAAIHELGHALYEQQIDPELDTTNLSGGASMGIHESQSRFYENMVGRSYPFWEKHYPKMQEIFKDELKDVDLDTFYKGINNVEESFIRVEADELTYPLHILLRYEMERAIYNDDVDLDTLPDLWNKLMKTYLNVTPEKASDGILQDVHWSAGLFGYFPTYALGSAYAAQIYYTLIKDIDFETIIKEDKIEVINEWLKVKIHQFGSTKKPLEILEEVTNEPFNPQYYVRYLKEKYTPIYLKK
ncbi:carboxypeptidase M32 [Liberiplasma polymorphum]|uniref:carboxypeptidase M32 n=1 Tax=Liberiplasma polymorphum TaxID=3374570 RepID=UPI0037769D39